MTASLTSYCVFLTFLEGRPVLGNVIVAPYLLRLMMTEYIVFHDKSQGLEIILCEISEIPLIRWKLSVFSYNM